MQMQPLRLCRGNNNLSHSCLSVTVWLWRNRASFPGRPLSEDGDDGAAYVKCSRLNGQKAPPPFTSVKADDLEHRVFWEMESCWFSLSSASFWSWSPVTMPIPFLHSIHYTVYQPLLFENVHRKNVFKFLVKEKKTFLKEFESFYFLFVWPTCKLEKYVFKQVLQVCKTFFYFLIKNLSSENESLCHAWWLNIVVTVNVQSTSTVLPFKFSFPTGGVTYLNPFANIINFNPTKPVIQDLVDAFQHVPCCQLPNI